eukprot:scaffold26988_cov197-Isochrysis_galbana.AAC.1
MCLCVAVCRLRQPRPTHRRRHKLSKQLGESDAQRDEEDHVDGHAAGSLLGADVGSGLLRRRHALVENARRVVQDGFGAGQLLRETQADGDGHLLSAPKGGERR